MFTVSFFGHRHIDNFKSTEEKVSSIIEQLITTHNEIIFLVGKEGNFDWIVSSIIRRKKNIYKKHELVLVLPYPTAEYITNAEYFEAYYDYVEVCQESAVAHPKAAYQIRNKNMVDRSDLSVFFVSKQIGGAAKTIKYTQKHNKAFINLAL